MMKMTKDGIDIHWDDTSSIQMNVDRKGNTEIIFPKVEEKEKNEPCDGWKWISVEDELPFWDNDEYFLTLDRDKTVRILKFVDVHYGGGGFFDSQGESYNVEYWCKLPWLPDQYAYGED